MKYRVGCVVFSVLLLLFVAGCESLQPQGRSYYNVADPAVVLYRSGESGWFGKDQDWDDFLWDFFHEEKDEKTADDDKTAYERLPLNDKIRYRMSLIERYHAAYDTSLYFRVAGGKTFFDFSELGLALATTVVGGETSKTILGAVTTAVIGIELSLSENFLQNQTSLAIIKTMKANRTEIRQKLVEGLEENRFRSEAEAESLLVEYFVAGSLAQAVSKLAEEAAKRAEEAEKQLAITEGKTAAELRKLRDLIIEYLNPASRDEARVRKVAEAIGQDDETGVATETTEVITLAGTDGTETEMEIERSTENIRNDIADWLYDSSRTPASLERVVVALGLQIPEEDATEESNN